MGMASTVVQPGHARCRRLLRQQDAAARASPTRRWSSAARRCSARAMPHAAFLPAWPATASTAVATRARCIPQLTSQHAQYVQATLKAWHDGTTWGDDAHAQIMPAIAKKLDCRRHRRAGQLRRRPAQRRSPAGRRHALTINHAPAIGSALSVLRPIDSRSVMLKRLPFLCAALLALAACSHDSDTGGAAQPATPTHYQRGRSRNEQQRGTSQRHHRSRCGGSQQRGNSTCRERGAGGGRRAVRRRRQMGRGQELLRDRSGPADQPSRQDRGDRGVLLRLPGVQCVPLHRGPDRQEPAGRMR